MKLVEPGKVTAIIGGQFGSEGKGVIQGYIGLNENIDYAITSASANAGHTCVLGDGRKLVTYHLPMAGVVSGARMILSAGAVIDPVVLEKEIDALERVAPELANIRSRLVIHPRAAVIEPIDVLHEQKPDSGAARIGSTQHGVGAAMARRVYRSARLAGSIPALSSYISEVSLNAHLERGARVVLEIPQGLGLGLYSGYQYPYCTGREVSVGQGMADAQIDPRLLGNVMVVLRTFPIRVGHIYNEAGEVTGDSGPFYPDSEETTWEKLGLTPEITTVTKRVRRVATFSFIQYREMLELVRPTHIFLNFANYLSAKDASDLIDQMSFSAAQRYAVTHLGMGPRITDVIETPKRLHENA